MNVLLVCSSGMSTGLLMRKMEKYALDKGIDFSISAVGAGAYRDECAGRDCILLGPQIAYRETEIADSVDIPVAVISPADYGIGNCEHIFQQIDGLLAQ